MDQILIGLYPLRRLWAHHHDLTAYLYIFYIIFSPRIGASHTGILQDVTDFALPVSPVCVRCRMDQILGSVAARMGQAQEEVADQIRNNFITLVQVREFSG